MISRKELISSKEFWLVKFQNSLFEQVEKYLKDNNITKTEFSKKLGVSKGYVSQILNGNFDHKVSKLIELSLAIDKVPFLKFENLDECIFLDSIGAVNATQEHNSPINIKVNFIKQYKVPKSKNSEMVKLQRNGMKTPIAFGSSPFPNQLTCLS